MSSFRLLMPQRLVLCCMLVACKGKDSEAVDAGLTPSPRLATTPAPTATAAPSPMMLELTKVREEAVADLRRVDATLVKNEWPKRCPTLSSDVLLFTRYGMWTLMGIDPLKENAYTYNKLTPQLVFDVGVTGGSVENKLRLWKTITAAQTMGIIVVTEHKPGEIVDRQGKPVGPSLTMAPGDKKFKSGRMAGWLQIVERQTGKALCGVSAAVSHPDSFSIKSQVGDHLDEYLRNALVAKFAAAVKTATHADLVDETGPVAKSPRYTAKP